MQHCSEEMHHYEYHAHAHTYSMMKRSEIIDLHMSVTKNDHRLTCSELHRRFMFTNSQNELNLGAANYLKMCRKRSMRRSSVLVGRPI